MSLVKELQVSEVKGYAKILNQPLRGKPVAVIGGGPGLEPWMMPDLDATDPILTNNAYMMAKRPRLVVAFDARYYKWHGRAIIAAGHRAFCALRDNQPSPMEGRILKFRRETRINTPREQAPEAGIISTRPDTLPGRNSGHGAINLAILMGAPRVYLAGFDMTFRDKRTHWHEGHRIPANLNNYERRFRPELENLVNLARHRGVIICAMTPTAADIPRVPYDEAMKDLHESRSEKA